MVAGAMPAAGQQRVTENNAHGWFNYFGDHPIGGSRWGAHIEGQWRRHNVVTQWQQLLLRPGVNYKVNDKLMLTFGYAFIETWPYGERPAVRSRVPEHRLWYQGEFRYRQGKAAWSTRLRFENRWVRAGDHFRYEDRMRMLQRFTYPAAGKLYFTAYDEFWVYIKPFVSNSWFDQNRAYAAVGHRFNANWRMEVGYMNQALLQRNGRTLESNHTLMVSMFSSAPFGRK